MATEQKQMTTLIKQPLFIAAMLIVIAIAIIWLSQKPTITSDPNMVVDSEKDAGDAINLKPPTTAFAGQNMPKIVQSMTDPEKDEKQVTAPGLESLVAGMEEKVAADPSVNNRLLLAQTYNELGMQDKALAGMRELQKEAPENGRVGLILSSMLSRSNDETKIKESLTLLEKLSGDKTIQQYLVNMYKGDALIRVQDHDGALKHWQLALDEMPEADNRRNILEKRIADLSTKGEASGESSGSNGKS